MERYLFMKPVLDRLADGGFVRKNFALCVRAGAVVAAMAGLVAFVDAWNFTSHMDGARIPGGIVYMLSLVAATYMAAHVMFIRAGEIAALPRTDFTLIPIGAVASLMIGEAYAAACAALGAGGGILIWFAGDNAYSPLHRVSFFLPFQGGDSFMSGVLYILRGAFRAVAALALGALASELFLVVEKVAGAARPGPPAAE